MKSKDSPNLYEILRASARPKVEPEPKPAPAPAAVAEAPKPSLVERLAAFKARKQQAKQEEAPAPPPAPEPVPVQEPVASAPEEEVPEGGTEAASPGERVIRITYNSAAFLLLVGVGLLFVAYSLGVRAGRAKAAMVAPASVDSEAGSTERGPSPLTGPPRGTAPAPVAPSEVFTLNLIEWKGETTEQRREAARMAEIWTRKLNEVGHPGAKSMLIRRGSEQRVALYLGSFTSRSSEEARAKLAAVRALKFRGKTPFGQASFELDPSSR
jgi:hypothetical protein